MADPHKTFQNKIGYTFSDIRLLQTALTHSSVRKKENYERLEFLGDRVLGVIVAELLYHRFPEEAEGDLAKRLSSLVQGATLAKLAIEIDLPEHVILSEAEKDAGGCENENILADVYEAIIGALYLDGGLEPCRKLIHAQWADILDVMIKPPMHPKTELQEWAQSLGIGLPSYDVTGQSGPDHAPIFEITLSVEGQSPVKAEGRSRAEAEKTAAKIMIKKLKAQK